MADTGALIQQIIKQKDAAILTNQEAMARILEALHKQVLDEIGKASITGWDQYRLKQMLDAIERSINEYESAAGAEITRQAGKMWDLGQESVYKPLNANGIYTGFNLSQATLDALAEFSYHKISGVANAAWDRIKTELTLGIIGTKTPQQVAEIIGKDLKSPGVFSSIEARADIIVKTESGRVFSEAAERRRQQAAETVDGLVKIWDHAGHPVHPRLSHLVVHGQQVPVEEPFRLRDKNNYQLRYPHDPDADISETINCGCDAVTWKESWGAAPKTFRPGGRPGTDV